MNPEAIKQIGVVILLFICGIAATIFINWLGKKITDAIRKKWGKRI